MANANEVLAAMEETSESARVILTIDENRRIVTIPNVAMVIGAKGDKNVNRIWFKISKNYRGTNLEGFVPKIYYTNAAGKKYFYTSTDATVDGDSILFSWQIGRAAVAETGTVSFGVCMQRLEGNKVMQEFNTAIATMQCVQSACSVEAADDSIESETVILLGSAVLGQTILG